jgi:hypothetical protein
MTAYQANPTVVPPAMTEQARERSLDRAASDTNRGATLPGVTHAAGASDFERLLQRPVGHVEIINGKYVAHDMEGMWRLAQAFANSEVCKARRDIKSAWDVYMILSHGESVGFHPVQSLNTIMVVNGRTSVWGDGAKALAEQFAQTEYIKEWIEGDEHEWVAHCEIKRRDRPLPTHCTFSWEDAKRAKLSTRDTYQSYPKRMLQMRARLFAIRDAVPEALMGLATVEEQQDIREPVKFDPDKAIGAAPAKPAPDRLKDRLTGRDIEKLPAAGESDTLPPVEPPPTGTPADETPAPEPKPKGRKKAAEPVQDAPEPETVPEPSEAPVESEAGLSGYEKAVAIVGEITEAGSREAEAMIQRWLAKSKYTEGHFEGETQQLALKQIRGVKWDQFRAK